MGVGEVCGLRTLIGIGERGGLRVKSAAVLTLNIVSSTGTGLDLLYCSARFSHARNISPVSTIIQWITLTIMFVLVHILGIYKNNPPACLALVHYVFCCCPNFATHRWESSGGCRIPKTNAVGHRPLKYSRVVRPCHRHPSLVLTFRTSNVKTLPFLHRGCRFRSELEPNRLRKGLRKHHRRRTVHKARLDLTCGASTVNLQCQTQIVRLRWYN